MYKTIVLVVLLMASCATKRINYYSSKEPQRADFVDTEYITSPKISNADILKEGIIDKYFTNLEAKEAVNIVNDSFNYKNSNNNEEEKNIKGSIEVGKPAEYLKNKKEINLYFTPEELSKMSLKENIVSVNDLSNFTNAIATYYFQDGKIYDLIVGTSTVTDFRLSAGEEPMGDIAIGDAINWEIGELTSGSDNGEIVHYIIRCLNSSSITTMVLPTNLRTYYLRLTGTSGEGMVGVRFISKDDSAIKRKNKKSAKNFIDPTNLNFNYSVFGKDDFGIENVFSDGRKTYIVFDKRFNNERKAPALYILKNGQLGILNYIISNNVYMVNLVLGEGEAFCLKEGKSELVIARKDIKAI